MRNIRILKDGKPVAKVILANHFFLRLRGLIGRQLSPGEGLLLVPCSQIHTFGMGYPIDAIYLDAANCVLRIDRAVPPGRNCAVARGAKKVLELSQDAAVAAGIQVGDHLEVKQ